MQPTRAIYPDKLSLGAQLDYAMSPETGLGSIQRITLKKKF